MNYEQLQKEQNEWSLRNFGPHPTWHAQLGIIEEVGELAHAHLKSVQGIRGTELDHFVAKVDAVADCVIFLSDYCTCMDWNLADEVEVAGKTIGTVGDAHELITKMSQQVGNPRGLLRLLMRYCLLEGIDFHDAVFSTWEQVKQRDWRKNQNEGPICPHGGRRQQDPHDPRANDPSRTVHSGAAAEARKGTRGEAAQVRRAGWEGTAELGGDAASAPE